jgi:ADP-ribose pyrophosphatase
MEQELFDGSTATFEKLTRDDTVLVVPVLEDGQLLLIDDEQPGRASVLTFPAGRMDKGGEEPLAAAKRELREETGYESEEWELWKAEQPFTKIDWAIYVFVARECRKVAEPSLDAGERITTRPMSLDELIGMSEASTFFNREIQLELVKAAYSADARALLEKRLFG